MTIKTAVAVTGLTTNHIRHVPSCDAKRCEDSSSSERQTNAEAAPPIFPFTVEEPEAQSQNQDFLSRLGCFWSLFS